MPYDIITCVPALYRDRYIDLTPFNYCACDTGEKSCLYMARVFILSRLGLGCRVVGVFFKVFVVSFVLLTNNLGGTGMLFWQEINPLIALNLFKGIVCSRYKKYKEL